MKKWFKSFFVVKSNIVVLLISLSVIALAVAYGITF